MLSVTFLLSKDPYAVDAGDTRISRLLLELAARGCSVRGIALCSGEPASGAIPFRCVPKPPRSLPAIVARAARSNRSLIHTRFNAAGLVDAVAADRSDVVVAEHTYMAEPAIDAGRGGSDDGLVINTHVLESMMLARTRSPIAPLLRLEARRTWRDELRCVSSAATTACLGSEELETLRSAGARGLRRLDLVLRPAESPAELRGPRAVFVGDRRSWPPNRDAYEALLDLWPGIAARVPGASLVVAGPPHPRETGTDDPSVEVLGYVPDLDEVWRNASVLLSPVAVGGGVRVKILDAVRHGVPVVATPQGLGAIGSYLPLGPVEGGDAFRDEAAALLASRELRLERGRELFEAGRELWSSDFLERQVHDWLHRR